MSITNLADRLPRDPVDIDAAFDIFLEWVFDQDIELYPAQEEAILELCGGNHVVLSTPTGSGKSLVATALHFFALNMNERSFYTAPIKALVSEKFFALCRDFGAENVGMLTGDASINHDAPIICCTAEVLANMAVRNGERTDADHVVMDEFHYYADRDRGMAWQIPLLALPHVRFLLMSATLGDTTEIERRIEERTGVAVTVVSSNDRPVPLEYEYREDPIQLTLVDLVKKGRAPVYVVAFSQREAAIQAQNLMSVDVCGKDDKRAIAEALHGFRFDTPYSGEMQRFVRHGVGLHHAGLLPKYRLLVEQLAQQGLLRVICGTDTLGVGVNIPIRTVLLTKLCKFDGEKTRLLTVRELRQVTGRAGRKGFDDHGWAVVQAPEHVIENRRLCSKGKKNVVMKKPPQKGYVHYDREVFERLVAGRPEPLEPVFRVDTGLLVNVLQGVPCDAESQAPGYRTLVELIGQSHTSPGYQRRLRRDAATLFKALVKAHVIDVVRREDGPGQDVWVAEGLQEDFSLHHTLSLFLVFAADRLDQRAETYPLDLLTLVESILENPRPILLRQEDRIKGELVAQMKAEGIPYDERMERLQDVTYPKPNAEWIYEQFNRFAERHPWMQGEAVRPKSVAREMYERYISFNDYVREYGIERVEGLLLRYLTQTYKTLVQNVPEYLKYDDVYDVIAYLRATLSRVDDSLLVEWERMLGGEGLPEDLQVELPARREPDITADPRAFAARVRAEMHGLLKALAGRDFEEAARCVRQTDAHPFPPEAFAEALEPFFESYGRIVFEQRARLADKTILTAAGHRVWEVTQVLCDPEQDDTYCIRGIIDLTEVERVTDAPFVEVAHIGE